MKSAWGPKLYDSAAWNSSQTETCLVEFEQLLAEDGDLEDWDKEFNRESSCDLEWDPYNLDSNLDVE
jgi:hypothetical protein